MMKRIAYLLSVKISFIAVFLCLFFNVKGQEITFDPVDSTENVSVTYTFSVESAGSIVIS